MINFKQPSLYVKGTASMMVFDAEDNSLIGISNKIDSSSFNSSVNDGEIRAGLGAPRVIAIPDSAAFTGSITAQDFSLEARKLSVGGILNAGNGIVPVYEEVTADGSGHLIVTKTPAAPYGTDAKVAYVDDSGTPLAFNSVTPKQIDGTYTALSVHKVLYYTNSLSASELVIPTQFAPTVARVIIKLAVYMAEGNVQNNSTLAGFLYIHIPRAQFNPDVSIEGSQTSNATTSWSFNALAYDQGDDDISACSAGSGVFGYMVYAPCGDLTQNVTGIAIVGSTMTVKVGTSVHVPVFIQLKDGSVVKPLASQYTLVSDTTAKATVSNGSVTGVAAGTANVTASITVGATTYSDTIAVTVSAS